MGFIPDIERICKLLPPRRQTLFFSATMPPEIQRLVDSFLKDPVRIEVTRPATAAGTITQLFRYCPSTEDWEKREVLRQLIRSEHVKNAIIFCNRKRDVAILLKSLLKHGFNAGALHGDMDQHSRTETLDAFREGRVTLLAASDVAARGLDIPDVSHIFNFDVPWQSDDYVHRIGRTGRAGKEGRSLTLVTPDDIKQLKDIEKMLGAPVTWTGDPPSAEDLASGARRRGRGGRRGGARPGAGEQREARGARPPARGGARHRPERRPGPAPSNGNGSQPDPVVAAPPSPVEPRPRQERERRPRSDRPQRAAAEQPPRQAREPRTREPRTREPRAARPPRQPWEPREPRRQPRHERGEGGPTPVGLGDHVPAFMRKTTRTV
jgi:superfamily II DNA/RNA helicase